MSLGPLITPERLVELSRVSSLRIFDCSVDIVPTSDGTDLMFETDGPRQRWFDGHLPGAAFADLVALCDNGDGQWMMLPRSAELFAASAGALGIGDDTHVVLYDSGMNMWAARLRWMLKVHGFDNVAVLDGGTRAWVASGRELEHGVVSYEAAMLTPHARPALVSDTADVAGAVEHGEPQLINAVSAEQHLGRGPFHAGRHGHIPTSLNVPYSALVDPETHRFLPPAELARVFARQGVRVESPSITYCGGAIAACSAQLALELLGATDVAVYDGSLREWSCDPARALITG